MEAPLGRRAADSDQCEPPRKSGPPLLRSMSINRLPQSETPVQAAADPLEQLVIAETRSRLESGSIHVFDEILCRVESAIISTVLIETDDNLTHAAMRLGISRPTLRSKIRAYMQLK